jgi:hypothetical protein
MVPTQLSVDVLFVDATDDPVKLPALFLHLSSGVAGIAGSTKEEPFGTCPNNWRPYRSLLMTPL